MELFGGVHLAILAAAAVATAGLAFAVRLRPQLAAPLRLALGGALVVNELLWWGFRYSREGLHKGNLPLQLCDATLWTTALACLTLKRPLVEFAYYVGIAGAGMAILTPDLWSPWPTYPAIYFFIAHIGIVAGAAMLVWGRIAPLEPGSAWRAFGLLAGYAAFAGAVNTVAGTNYMYLCRKPDSASLLDAMGPWPVYLAGGAAVAIAAFWLLSIPAKLTSAGKAS